MDFDLTEEQRLLKDSVDRLLADRYDFEQRKKYRPGDEGWGRGDWAQYAEMGLLAARAPCGGPAGTASSSARKPAAATRAGAARSGRNTRNWASSLCPSRRSTA